MIADKLKNRYELTLVDDMGVVLGKWVVVHVGDTQTGQVDEDILTVSELPHDVKRKIYIVENM